MAEEEKAGAEETKKDRSGLMRILFLVLNLAVVGGGAALTYLSTIGYQSPIISEASEEEKLKEMRLYMEENPIVYTMEPFTVNLAGRPKRTIRLEMSIEMLSEEGFEELIRQGGPARDEIVNILNRKKFEEIESIQGKLFLKDQIARKVNSYLEKGVVKDIYFSDFVVQ